MSKMLLAAASFVALASAANAATYVLSYDDLSDNQYGAVLTADLDVDGNTLFNIDALEFTINGVLYPADLTTTFTSAFLSGTSTEAVLTLDGSTVDFYIAVSAGDYGFAMDTTQAPSEFGVPIFTSSEIFLEEFTVGNYSLTEVAPVPLPAALPLSIAALGGLGLVARRRKAA